MKETVLITGGSGLLAINWARCIKSQYKVVLGMHNRMIKVEGCKSIFLPISSVKEIIDLVKAENCEIVIHTVAITSIEQCENEPELAEYVNVKLAENMAIACQYLDVSFVHISTDQLFKGTQQFMTEDCLVSPLNIYGKTKAESEKIVLESNIRALIIRTNFYGWGLSYRKSFSDMIIGELHKERSIRLFKDVFYTPILIDTLVKIVHDLIKMKLSGVYNIVGNDRISKYDFGLKVAKIFSLDMSLVESGSLSDRKDLITRPLDMSLSNKKINEIC